MVFTCLLCYKKFNKKYNLNRHSHLKHKNSMSENNISDGNTSDEEPNRKPYLYRNIFDRLRPNRSKSHHYEEDDNSEQDYDDESSTIGNDNGKQYDDVNKNKHIDIWKYFTELTYEQGDDVLNETASKMRNEDPDSSLEEIRNKAFEKLRSVYHKAFREVYLDFIGKMYALQRNPTHKKIMGTVKRLREEDNFETDEAIQYAVKKRKFMLERVMDKYPLPELEETFDDDDDDDDDDDYDDDDDDDSEKETSSDKY